MIFTALTSQRLSFYNIFMALFGLKFCGKNILSKAGTILLKIKLLCLLFEKITFSYASTIFYAILPVK